MTLLAHLAPGLWVLGVLALLAAALERWYDGVPRRVLAAFYLVVSLLFGRALFFGDVLLPLNLLRDTPPFQGLATEAPGGFALLTDQVTDFVPYFSQSRRLMRELEWPLVNQNVGAGEPFLANSQAENFHPFRLLALILPLPQAIGAVAALKVLGCLVFTFLLLRRCGLGEASAAGGAVAYALSGFVLHYLGWPHSQSATALPLVLYAIELALSRAARRDLLLLALGVFTLIQGGHPETVVYAAGMGVLFAADRGWSTTRGLDWRDRLRRWWRPLAAVALGVLLTAPTTLATLHSIPRSERRYMVEIGKRHQPKLSLKETLAADDARLDAVKARALPVLAPLAYGSVSYGRPWGTGTIARESAFAGTATLFLVVLGLLRRRRRWFAGERSLTLAAFGALVIFVDPPGLAWLMSRIPLLELSGSGHVRVAMIVCFGFAFLAACAWERICRNGVRPALAVGLGLAFVLAILWAYRAHPNPTLPGHQIVPRTSTARVQVAVAGALTLGLLAFARSRSARERHALAWTFAVLAGLELYQIHGGWNVTQPRAAFFPERASIRFLQDRLGSDRMIALEEVFQLNYPLVYGLADLRSGNPLQPAALERVTRPLRKGIGAREYEAADHPLLDLLGVRYVVVKAGRELPGLSRVFAGNVWIYERPGPLPRLFLPRQARRLAGEDWSDLKRISDFRRLALVDEVPDSLDAIPVSDSPSQWRLRRLKAARLEALSVDRAQIRADVELAAPGLLASSVYQDGGWRVLLDGRRIATIRTNGAFVGAWLPAGRHAVRLVYRPPGFLPGLLLAGLAAALLAALVVPPPYLRRSSPSRPAGLQAPSQAEESPDSKPSAKSVASR